MTEQQPDPTQQDPNDPAPAATPEASTSGTTDADTTEPGTDPEVDDGQEDGDDPGRASRQAAGYRRRLRDAEAELTGLRAHVDVLRRGEIERLAGQHLVKPAALWVAGVPVEDFLAEDGSVDPKRVDAVAGRTALALGLPNLLDGNIVRREGSNPRPARVDHMAEVIRGD